MSTIVMQTEYLLNHNQEQQTHTHTHTHKNLFSMHLKT